MNRQSFRLSFRQRSLSVWTLLYALCASVVICLPCPAAQLHLNLGAAANDGTGDSLRVAFGKIETNFLSLFSSTNTTVTGTNMIYDTVRPALVLTNFAGLSYSLYITNGQVVLAPGTIALDANGVSIRNGHFFGSGDLTGGYNLGNGLSNGIFTITSGSTQYVGIGGQVVVQGGGNFHLSGNNSLGSLPARLLLDNTNSYIVSWEGAGIFSQELGELWTFNATSLWSNNTARLKDITNALTSALSNYPSLTQASNIANVQATNVVNSLVTNAANAAATNVVNGALNLVTPVLLPRHSNQVLYAFGDSQTAGWNFSGASYTSNSMILPQYRWPNLLASSAERNLSVSNFGIGGATIYMVQGSIPPITIFNSMGRLTNSWEGVTTIMGGWNDMGNEPNFPPLFWALTRAHEAMIAKALINDYFALSFVGWTRTSQLNNDTPGWATTGSNYQQATSDRDSIPFWFPNLAARYCTQLITTQYVTFQFQNKKAGALFFDTCLNSGVASVYVNGTNVANVSLVYGQGNPYQYPAVVWLENLPATATIVITNQLAANKTNFFLAAGYVDYYTQTPNRTVLVGTCTANTNSSRSLTNLWFTAKAAEAAVASFARLGYPVYLANTFNTYVNATDFEPSDQSHFTPAGHQHVANAFQRAYVPSGYGSSNVVVLNRTLTQ